MRLISIKLKSIIITGVIILCVVFSVLFMARGLNDAVYSENRLLPIYNVKTDESKVALTFNVAAGGDIDEILNILDKYNVKSTFFFLGCYAEKNPEDVKKIIGAGHEAGNHSYSHKDPKLQTEREIAEDISKCNSLIESISGVKPKLYRPPSGSYDNKTIDGANSLCMTSIQWDVDTVDWKNISKDEIIARVRAKTKNGSIIQLHTGTKHTAEALEEIIVYLNSKNFKLVKVSELIFTDNFYIDNCGTQIKIEQSSIFE